MKKVLAFIVAMTITLFGTSKVSAIHVQDIGYDGSNVKLEGDSSKGYTLTLTGDAMQDLELQSGENVTLDLKGHNFTNYTDTLSAIWIPEGATLTIKDTGSGYGNVSAKAKTDKQPPVVNNAGTLIVEGGLFASDYAGGAAIYNSGNLTISGENTIISNLNDSAWGLVNVLGGKTTIKGGDFIQGGSYSVVLNSGDIEIEGGLFTVAGVYGSDEKVNHNSLVSTVDEGKTTISNGEFDSDIIFYEGESAGSTTVIGGEFGDVDVSKYVPDGYLLDEGGKVSRGIQITFNGRIYASKQGEKFQIGNAKNADGKTLKEAMDELKKNVPSTKNSVYYVDEEGNRVYYTTETDKDMTVTSKYTIKVEVNGKKITPNEGTKVKDIKVLAEIAKDDHFYYFEDEEGNHYTLEDKLNNNVKLTTIYKVTIKVNPVDGVSMGLGYTTRRGTTLRDILGKSWGTGLQSYLDSEGFLKFVDENGNEIGLDDEITEDTVLTAIYKVVVKFNDEEFVLELAKGESAKIGNAKNADGKTLKEAMDELRKNVPSTKNSVYYVDEEGNRVYYTTETDKDMTVTSKYTIKVEVNGKVVTPNEGTKVKDIKALAEIAKDDHFYYFEDEEGNHYTLEDELNNNVKLTAIYKVTIKVNPVDGVSIGVGYTTRRGTTLRDILGKSWGTGLQAYIDSEGFLNFVDENGNEIGLDDEITEDTVLTAIYTKSEDNSENNDVVTPDVTVEEVPTTNPQTLDNIMVYVVMAVGSILAIVIGILVAKKNKIFNK